MQPKRVVHVGGSDICVHRCGAHISPPKNSWGFSKSVVLCVSGVDPDICMRKSRLKIKVWRLIRSGGWLAVASAWALSFLVLGGWLIQATLHERGRTIPPPGKMVLVSGEWLHLDCRGNPQHPMVLLEAGAMGWSSVWEWFFVYGKKNHYVCAWDRAGMGWSQHTTRPADSVASAQLLHQLLHTQKLNDRSFVLVGHSLGALYALTYQKLYPQDVRALVLLDPAHPQQLQRLPASAVAKTLDQVTSLNAILPLLDFGVARGMIEWKKDSSLHRLPASVYSSVLHVSSSRQHLDRAVQEYLAWPKTAQAATVPNMPDIPVLVVSASAREAGNRVSNHQWWALHQGLANLSPQGAWVVVPHTAHQSLIMKESAAVLVWERIEQLERLTP